MRDEKQLRDLSEQVAALRRAGKSRREIRTLTGIVNNEFLTDALRGVPPPEWTLRPNAKDDLRARARELRAVGMAYNDIVRELGVSKSSVSLWVRDLPRLGAEEIRLRQAAGIGRYWCDERPRRRVAREAASAEAGAELGGVGDRDILIAGAVAYWCEGAKAKPERPAERVIFSNTDAGLIRLFQRFLTIAGMPPDAVTCRLQIHETAHLDNALEFWREQTGLAAHQFRKPTLKPARPQTVRKNTGPGYHGCLAIYVRQSRELYRRIEGWALAAMSGASWPRQLATASARSGPARPTWARADQRRSLVQRSAEEIGTLSRREAVIAGAIAYWCEGSKSKPYRRADRVAFANSDPMIIGFFLNFLALVGVAPERIVCRVHIHESADVAAAEQFWQAYSEVPAGQFRRSTLKRHVPKTVRRNPENDYHGCLVVSVLGSRELYWQVEGWAAVVMAANLSGPRKDAGPALA
jgi:hypothetical protein